MVKRLKAILLLTLMLGSTRFAKAETPKGEAYKTNKINIETQTPVEDTSLENDIVKTDEATKEEVIIGQESQEETELQVRLQQICSKIDEVALELDGEIQRMTVKEHGNKINNIVDAVNNIARYENIRVGATTYFNVVTFEYLPEEIQSKVIMAYTKNYEEFDNNFLDGTLPIPNYAADDINLAIQFCCSEAQEDLTQMFDEMCKGLGSEVEKGQLGGINFKALVKSLNYAKDTLSNSGILSFIVDTYGSTVYSIVSNKIGELRDNNEPIPENVLEDFNGLSDLLITYRANASEVLDNKVDIFLGQEK